jgi:hypothetical protein
MSQSTAHDERRLLIEALLEIVESPEPRETAMQILGSISGVTFVVTATLRYVAYAPRRSAFVACMILALLGCSGMAICRLARNFGASPSTGYRTIRQIREDFRLAKTKYNRRPFREPV